MAQPQPRDPDPLVEERRQPPCPPPTRQRPDRLQESPYRPTRPRPSGIGPKRALLNRDGLGRLAEARRLARSLAGQPGPETQPQSHIRRRASAVQAAVIRVLTAADQPGTWSKTAYTRTRADPRARSNESATAATGISERLLAAPRRRPLRFRRGDLPDVWSGEPRRVSFLWRLRRGPGGSAGASA